MARFTYRMESILNIKIQLENQAKMEFGQAQAAYLEQEDKLAAMKAHKEDIIEEGRNLRGRGFNALDLKENEQALKAMESLIEGQTEQVKLAARAVERARAKLTGIIQERKAQERLKERAFEEYLEEEKHAESKEIDELVSYRYGAGGMEDNGS